jgi:YHS domain-containing protein
MKHLTSFSVLLLLALGVSACSKPAAATATATAAAPATAPAATTTAVAAAPAPAKPYPFSTSVVSGEKLGPKDSLVIFVQDGYQIKLASAAEADTFKKTPAVYMAKITDAYKNAKPCPLTVCPVMGDALDADAYAFVYEGRQFKFCCDACMDDFEKDPAKFEKIWDDAAAAKNSAAPVAAKQ